jgi:hypothetical protein
MPGTRWCLGALLALVLAVLPVPAVAEPSAALGAPPGIPTSVSVTPGAGSAVVSWVAPADEGGSTVSGYTVTAQPGGQVAKVPGVARSATVMGLSDGVAYRFTVVASNHAGPGRPSAVSGAVVPSAAPAPTGPTLIDDDFAADAGGMEAVEGGTWGTASGRYVLSAPADEGVDVANANLAVHPTVVSGDFTLSALAATTPTASPFNDFSVVFGYRGPADYWFASFSEGNDDNTSGIFRVAGGVRTQLADIAVPIAAGTLYPVRIERRGAAIRVFRSGEQVAAVDDGSLGDGRVGFGSRNDGGTFDDLLVTGPAPVPPPPAAAPGFLARIWAWVASLFSDGNRDGAVTSPARGTT